MGFTGTWALPAPTVDGVLDDGGNHGYLGDKTLPFFTLTGTFGEAFNAFTGDKSLAMPSLEGILLGGNNYAGDFLLSRFTLSGQLKNGNAYSGAFTLPMFTKSGTLRDPDYTAAWELPMFLLSGRLEAAVTASFRGWPVNLKNFALVEVDNFPFNSFAKFNGETLAAGDGGIFALSGDTDNGTKITARVRFALSDYGISQLKRAEEVFISYRSPGTLILRIIIDGGQTFEYPLEPTGETGIYTARVKTGKGLKFTYASLEIENFDGCDFDLDAIRVSPVVLYRRV